MATHPDGHLVTVVVPTIGRWSFSECRQALARQTRPPDEIVVVEDRDRRGPAWARNEGIRLAKGDLVAFTDDDCVPSADWLERLVSAIDRHGAAGAGGTLDETDPLLADKKGRRGFPDREVVDETGRVGDTGNVAYRRDWLDRLAREDGHVFDERYGAFGSEDVEMALRLRARGARLVFVPSGVSHLRRATTRGYLVHQYRRGRGIAILDGARKRGGFPVAPGKSLLWDASGKSTGAAGLIRVLLKKGLGPFDAGSFRSFGAFLVFWAGEKAEGLGYLRQKLAGGGSR
jgi:GT2 family glycosyltransferase